MHFLHFTWRDILVQGLGFVAFAIYVVAYQAKDPRRTQLLFAPANFLYGIQCFLLIGALTSSSMVMFAAAVRDGAVGYCSDRFIRRASGFYIAFIWIISFLFHKDWHEYMMAVTGSVTTLATLVRSDFYKYRTILMVRQCVSLLFGLWITSLASVVYSSFTIASNIIGAYRYYKGRKNVEPVLPLPQD